MSNKLLFGPDQGWSLEPVATWLYTEGRRLRDAALGSAFPAGSARSSLIAPSGHTRTHAPQAWHACAATMKACR